jgi:hypothetical protein
MKARARCTTNSFGLQLLNPHAASQISVSILLVLEARLILTPWGLFLTQPSLEFRFVLLCRQYDIIPEYLEFEHNNPCTYNNQSWVFVRLLCGIGRSDFPMFGNCGSTFVCQHLPYQGKTKLDWLKS